MLKYTSGALPEERSRRSAPGTRESIYPDNPEIICGVRTSPIQSRVVPFEWRQVDCGGGEVQVRTRWALSRSVAHAADRPQDGIGVSSLRDHERGRSPGKGRAAERASARGHRRRDKRGTIEGSGLGREVREGKKVIDSLRRGGETGRRTGLKILSSARNVRVRSPPPALFVGDSRTAWAIACRRRR